MIFYNFQKSKAEVFHNTPALCVILHDLIYRLLFFPLPELPFVPPRSRRTSASPGAGLLPGPPPFGCSFTISMERLSGRSIFFTKGPVILPVTLAMPISSVDLDLSRNGKGGTLEHDVDPLTIVDEIFRHDLLLRHPQSCEKIVSHFKISLYGSSESDLVPASLTYLSHPARKASPISRRSPSGPRT